ncbi:hypothetical protein A3H26_00685 [candidate division WWE3 bacterium RIFCSPLOWO2_12_FULL_36_10]|uniref:Transposase IS200-like domain-containing protein n=1 Tax=candidate division WWE3 bacterium RIFCSPLOWO2_12_FULL_36_10 TaxID=1802630 RepID=A0A1F4VL21_UNCKA|nr:MAG: hypothetical protein A3H26_00685 [candidate division WWE3 bacterium RIFCSPLOWO2_12_FULL_36_10]
MSRSIKGLNLFNNIKDYEMYLYKLSTLKIEGDFKLHCFCLMSTHTHLCIETGSKMRLSKIMHRLNTYFTVYSSYKYKIGGPLFRNRYESIVVDKYNYLLRLSRYIHLNPVKAGLVLLPEQYLWSSFTEYIEKNTNRNLVDVEDVLSYFGSENNYKEFVYDGMRNFDDMRGEIKARRYLGSKRFISNINRRLRLRKLR